MPWFQRSIDRLIDKARHHAAAGDYRKALKINLRGLALIDSAVRADRTGIAGLANQPAAARLHYDQASLHHNLDDGDKAVQAAWTAELLYTGIDPTRGDPALVEETIRDFRRQHPGQTDEFEDLIGDAANARSQLAWMLACHRGAAAAAKVEHLGRNAIRTYEELIRVSRRYGNDDLRLVLAQVAQAHELLRRA
ncbi:hypothetical protein C8D88_105334 [Lentzea atacamensis]|uniref:Tetratricopeptide repeat protein n=1 Tax=Lentzea atacamensis TaxID=531938 RepID=A0A316I1B1_9PSEU|nr:hypothetical protein [Lentzea atacamensis]PWK86291.1 hypothetical protein C8D88_105334 [Lentzea atacamensis]